MIVNRKGPTSARLNERHDASCTADGNGIFRSKKSKMKFVSSMKNSLYISVLRFNVFQWATLICCEGWCKPRKGWCDASWKVLIQNEASGAASRAGSGSLSDTTAAYASLCVYVFDGRCWQPLAISGVDIRVGIVSTSCAKCPECDSLWPRPMRPIRSGRVVRMLRTTKARMTGVFRKLGLWTPMEKMVSLLSYCHYFCSGTGHFVVV